MNRHDEQLQEHFEALALEKQTLDYAFSSPHDHSDLVAALESSITYHNRRIALLLGVFSLEEA